MKYFIFLFCLIICFNISGFAQQIKKDRRPQIQKEDGLNMYNSHKINDLDLIQALDFAGIGIHKFNLGTFDKKYNFLVTIKEYKNQEIINTDTLLKDNNEYAYYKRGKEDYFIDYIDQIKIFTRKEEEKLTLRLHTYNIKKTKEIHYDKTTENQYFRIREYVDVDWRLNTEIPLMIYASSWYDEHVDSQRFCGVVNLSKNGEMTEELLSNSPHYFVVNYKVTETKK